MDSQIKSEEYYTLSQVVKNGLVPWIKSTPTLRRIILNQNSENPKLKVLVEGEGTAKRYKIKGIDIINFLTSAEITGRI